MVETHGSADAKTKRNGKSSKKSPALARAANKQSGSGGSVTNQEASHRQTLRSPTTRHRLVAFELGISLNQLSWFWKQALVTGNRDQIRSVTDLLDKMPSLIAQLIPLEHVDHLGETATNQRSDWQSTLSDLGFGDDWYACYQDAQDINELLGSLELLLPDFAIQFGTGLEKVLNGSPDLSRLVQLGRTLDAGRHPPGLRGDEFMWSTPDMGRGTAGSPQQAASRLGGRRRAPIVLPVVPPQPIKSGLLPPSKGWFEELRALYESILPDVLLPQLTNRKLKNSKQFSAWTDKQIRLTQEHLRTIAISAGVAPNRKPGRKPDKVKRSYAEHANELRMRNPQMGWKECTAAVNKKFGLPREEAFKGDELRLSHRHYFKKNSKKAGTKPGPN